MEETQGCVVCGRPQSTALCSICGEPVCPEHRLGTGRLEHGYTCMGGDRQCFVRRGKVLLNELTKVIKEALARGTFGSATATVRRRMPVYELSITVLGPDGAVPWLESPNRAFGGATPMALLDTDDDAGVERVLDELRRIQHGHPS